MPIDPLLPVGILLLVSGWLVIPMAVRLSGFAIGLFGGILLLDLFALAFPDWHVPAWGYLVSAIVFGCLGASAATTLLWLAIFLCGVFCALTLKVRLDETFHLSRDLAKGPLGEFALSPWFTAAVGLLGGALLSLLRRYLLIVLSSLAGAVLIARGAHFDEKWLTLALVGIGFQTLCCVAPRWRKRAEGP
jgi:hypothetical protein